MEITVLNRQRAHPIRADRLREFLSDLVRAMPPAGADSVAVALVSDKRIRAFNRDYRGRDRATDVLSFPADAGDPVPSGERHLGDIVISVATAAHQAREAGHSLEHELQSLALHGYLHLLGYDHETDGGTMMRLQRKLARRLLESPRAG